MKMKISYMNPDSHDKHIAYGECVWEELCEFSLTKSISEGKTKIGIVFWIQNQIQNITNEKKNFWFKFNFSYTCLDFYNS